MLTNATGARACSVRAAWPDQESRAAARVHEVDRALGDPTDETNPVSFARLLDSDEAGQPHGAAEAVLDELELNAEFVPSALGGRLERIDTLARILRQVYRRDAALGLGYGVTSFMASVNVWTAGSEELRRRLALILRQGAKVSVAYHELAHGNDFVSNEFEARAQVAGGYRLYGSKQVINNAGRAAAWVLFGRTSPAAGSRSHSVLLVEREGLDPGSWGILPRYLTVGMRGCSLQGLTFDGTPVPGSALIGSEGQGVELAMRSFQITRVALPSMAVGTVDTGLRTVMRFAAARRLYRGTVLDIPHARRVLADAFVNLMVCDCFALVGARALHLLPRETSVVAAAVKYLAPEMLTETMTALSTVLGARFYLREGECGIFQKHLRDLPVLGLGHAGSTACLATIIPQLHRLARRSWFRDQGVPMDLFDPRGALLDIRFGSLELMSDRDSLAAWLIEAADELGAGSPEELLVRDIARRFAGELRVLREQSLGLPPLDRTALARPVSYNLADRYAVILAAASVLGVWRRAQGGFLADPAWVAVALHNLWRRLRRGVVPEPPRAALARIHDELVRRLTQARSYDLYDTQLSGLSRADFPIGENAMAVTTRDAQPGRPADNPGISVGTLTGWLVERVAVYLENEPDKVDLGVPLAEYGLSSVGALALCGDIEEHFDVILEATAAWDYPTVNALAQHIMNVGAGGNAVA